MLGSLARWFRFAGFDTVFDPKLDDAALTFLARTEERWLLTADRALASRTGPRVILVLAPTLDEQVAWVSNRLGLTPDPSLFFTRCSRCNAVVETVTREAVASSVPPFVAARADRFSRCRGCGRVYWPGTHSGKIRRRVCELFGIPSGTGDHDGEDGPASGHRRDESCPRGRRQPGEP